jgi:hypothetical protein
MTLLSSYLEVLLKQILPRINLFSANSVEIHIGDKSPILKLCFNVNFIRKIHKVFLYIFFLKEIRMKLLAYYSVFAGPDHTIGGPWGYGNIPKLPSEVYDCYYFTNNKTLLEKLKLTKWIPVFIDKIHKDDVYDSNIIAKEPKVCPHRFKELNDYEYLVYQDTKLVPKGDTFVLDIIQKCGSQFILFAYQHYAQTTGDTSVFREFHSSMNQERYLKQKDKILAYINTQIELGYSPYDTLHLACGFLIRNNKHQRAIELNEMWYAHILECGIQDQISFYFVKQRFPGLIAGLPFILSLL